MKYRWVRLESARAACQARVDCKKAKLSDPLARHCTRRFAGKSVKVLGPNLGASVEYRLKDLQQNCINSLRIEACEYT